VAIVINNYKMSTRDEDTRVKKSSPSLCALVVRFEGSSLSGSRPLFVPLVISFLSLFVPRAILLFLFGR
jgi:hypothetical protein